MRVPARFATCVLLGTALGLTSCEQDESPVIEAEKENGKTRITIDTDELKRETEAATEEAREAGRRAVSETGKALQRAGEALEGAADEDAAAEP